MKKPILIFTISINFLLITINLFAQWQWQNPLPQGNDINKIHFTDEDHGWVVGVQGLKMHTNDGGDTWHVDNVETYSDLTVHFLNSNIGWIFGQDTILKTSDGGSTWVPVDYQGEYSFSDMSFTDQDKGWAISDKQIYFTEDGVGSWTLKYNGYSNQGGRLYSICFVNDSTGYASGYRHNYGTGQHRTILLATDDAGETWTEPISVNCENYPDRRSVIFFVNENEGWLGGPGGLIRHTSDGGNTWQTQTPGSVYHIHDLFMINPLNGFYVCETGHIYKTSNGGINWTYVHDEPEFTPNSIHFTSETNGFIAGRDGKILHANDGGLSWNHLSNYPGITNKKLEDGYFVDQETGWAVGNDGIIIHTADGGENWEIQNSPAYDDLKSVFFIDQELGWTIANDILLKTQNGGSNWTVSMDSSEYNLNDIYFLDQNNGWITGHSPNPGDGVILHTDDGGNNWEVQFETTIADSTDWLNALTFSDSLNGWAVGSLLHSVGGPSGYKESTIYHTDNGGLTWARQENECTANLSTVFFADNLNGWVAGIRQGFEDNTDYILHTDNGGQNWEIQYEGGIGTENEFLGIKTIFFTDPMIGWAVAGGDSEFIWEYGAMLKTTDGGETWNKHYCPATASLCSIFFTDMNHGWAFGHWGTILNMDLGGITEIEDMEYHISKLQLSVFPNPCSGKAQLHFSTVEVSYMIIELINTSGAIIKQLIKKVKLPGIQVMDIDLGDTPSGVYFCVLKTNEGMQTQKIIKL